MERQIHLYRVPYSVFIILGIESDVRVVLKVYFLDQIDLWKWDHNPSSKNRDDYKKVVNHHWPLCCLSILFPRSKTFHQGNNHRMVNGLKILWGFIKAWSISSRFMMSGCRAKTASMMFPWTSLPGKNMTFPASSALGHRTTQGLPQPKSILKTGKFGELDARRRAPFSAHVLKMTSRS